MLSLQKRKAGDTMDDYLKFQFRSIRSKSKAFTYVALTKNPEDLQLFLKQHKFDNVPKESITLLPESEFRQKDESCVLRPYKFKSNRQPFGQVFTIMSNQDIVEGILDPVSEEICKFSLFGEAIVRRDIEVFKVIGNIISDLPATHVVDFSLVDMDEAHLSDEDDLNESAKSTQEFISYYIDYDKRITYPTEDHDMSVIRDDLDRAYRDSVDADSVLPFTIEAYIEHFVSMMTDSF